MPFSVGGSIPGREAKIPHTSQSKKQSILKKRRSDIVTNSIKTLKMVHIKKKKKTLEKENVMYA